MQSCNDIGNILIHWLRCCTNIISRGNFVDRKKRLILVGQFEIGRIIRVNRKNDEHTISDKIFDFSRNTIQQLKESGYNNTMDLSDVEFS